MKLEHHWYRPQLTPLTACLFPLSKLFLGAVKLRQFLYQRQIKKTIHFAVPIIVVGNLTVGGTGKTPFVIWLAQFLKSQGYTPGIVSRGVGGKQKTAHRVNASDEVRQVGDEAKLLQQSGFPIVVGIDRVACVEKLLAQTQCDIVISDDGLQHYRLGRMIEIALIDGMREFGNQHLLPAGPLREPISRLAQMDFVIKHGGTSTQEFQMQLVGDQLCAVKNPTLSKPLQPMRAHAVAAIGNPDRFLANLRAKQLEIIPHVFPDHYFYHAQDFVFGDDLPIIMTEKDAVKCQTFADERFWFMPVNAKVDEALGQKILLKLGAIK